MSTFAVDGLVSGLDTTSLISQLMQLEGQGQQRLRTQVTRHDNAISAYRSVSTRLQAVGTAATSLASDGAWTARTAAVSGTSVTATAGAGAPLGSLSVSVTSLATRATWTTDQAFGLDDATAFTDLPIVVHKTDGTTVSISPPSGTMREVVAAINSASGTGVTAVAVKTGTNEYRLQVIATESGTAGAPASITGLTRSGTGVTAAAATNAAYSVNGMSATSASNVVPDAVSGLSLTLTATGTSTVTVAEDTARIAARVQALVTAANDALSEIGKQAGKDASGTRGPLSGDGGVRGIADRLLSGVADAVGGASAGAYGLQTTRDGRLTFDAAAFSAAYAKDPAAARAVLAPASGTGVAQRLSAVVTAATGVGGSLTSAIEGRESTKTDLTAQIASWDVRLATRRSALERQYAALEVALSRTQAQQGWLTQQLGNLAARS